MMNLRTILVALLAASVVSEVLVILREVQSVNSLDLPLLKKWLLLL